VENMAAEEKIEAENHDEQLITIRRKVLLHCSGITNQSVEDKNIFSITVLNRIENRKKPGYNGVNNILIKEGDFLHPLEADTPHEKVFAIFESSSCYLVLTPNRGAIYGDPYLYSKGEVKFVRYKGNFEEK
jgi:hypothetical protein